jgi:hypothetical protein
MVQPTGMVTAVEGSLPASTALLDQEQERGARVTPEIVEGDVEENAFSSLTPKSTMCDH